MVCMCNVRHSLQWKTIGAREEGQNAVSLVNVSDNRKNVTECKLMTAGKYWAHSGF